MYLKLYKSMTRCSTIIVTVHVNSRYLYWLDGGTRPKIERTKLDGSARSLVFDLREDYPSALGLDVEKQVLYWNNGNDQSVWRGRTDGTGKQQLASKTVHSFPNMIGISVLGDCRSVQGSGKSLPRHISSK